MRVLVVGAGALGQPLGYHMHQGGADVAYMVKPKYREVCEAGFTLHRYRMFGEPVSQTFDGFDVFVDDDALADETWDQVWLCISSTAVQGEWLEALLEAVGTTTLVSIQPGLEARNYLEDVYPAERIVSARISMIAWQTPLRDENLPEGDIAYFLPPAQPVYFGRGEGRAEEVASLLDSGGCPADVHDEVVSYDAFSSALLEPSVAALETVDWSLREFRKSDALSLAARAASEAVQVVGAEFDAKPPLPIRLAARKTTMRLGLPVMSWLMPFDLEAYLEEHFTKVGDQTREELADFIEAGEAHDLEVDGIRDLMRALPAPKETT